MKTELLLKGCGIFMLICMVPLGLSGQNVPQPEILEGFVMDQNDTTGIPNVHVINLTKARGTTTAADGSFSITAARGDSVMFQAIGYRNDTISVTERFLKDHLKLRIVLIERVYELPTVDVFPYATFAEFKHAFLNFKDPDPPIEFHLPEIYYMPEEPAVGTGIRAPGPISAFYDHFSRRSRELQKYKQVLANEEISRKASRVLSVEMVKSVTGLQNDREVYDFMEYCNLTDEFILSHKEYEVYAILFACYERYCEEK